MDMMDVRDDNYNLISHTPNEPIEINDDFATIIKLGSNLQIDKVCATTTSNETWWYEQPQTTHVLASCVTFAKFL
jgi:hypothetical protein